MRIPLHKLTVEEVFADLPDTCPHCQRPTSDGVRLGGYDAVVMDATVETGVDSQGQPTAWFDAEDGDVSETLCYADVVYCAGCASILADADPETEEHPGP